MSNMINTLDPKVPTAADQDKNNSGSLRPPTLMIDLLFGALMLFAFQMGYVDKPVTPHNVELPTAPDKQKKKAAAIYSVIPIIGKAGKWQFKVNDDRLLSAAEIKKEVRKKKQTPVMIFSRTTDLQSYLEAEQELRRHGLKPGLAVQNKEGR